MLGIEDGDAGVPYLGEVWAHRHAAQGQEVVSAALTPKHAGLFESSPNDGFAARFDHSAADKAVSYTHLTLPTNREV